MRRLLFAVAIVAVTATCPVAQASDLSVLRPLKYPVLDYSAAPGETNNLIMRTTSTGLGQWPLGVSHFGDSETVVTDTGAVIRASSECVAAGVAGVCVLDGLDYVRINLGDGDDRADVHHPESYAVPTYITCGSGFDRLRALGSNMYIGDDCESVVRT